MSDSSEEQVPEAPDEPAGNPESLAGSVGLQFSSWRVSSATLGLGSDALNCR